MKTKIFNLVTYSFLIYSILCAVFVALPQEYQDKLPQFNWVTALVSGGSTALIGTGGVVVNSFMNKTRQDSTIKYASISEKYLEIKDAYKCLNDEIIELRNEYVSLNNLLKRNNQLLETDLKAKLSNPLIEAEVKKMIEGVTSE